MRIQCFDLCSSPWHYARANGYGKIHPITVLVCRRRDVISVVCRVVVVVVPWVSMRSVPVGLVSYSMNVSENVCLHSVRHGKL